ncbi:MAG: EAL domain-containing protein [Flavobacteriales bacterium]|nr:EAL domain-containing protein [Flavobacteriales bacterium]
MTLSKQLYALITLIALFMGLGTLYISIQNTRAYLMLQLSTQTQNAADSLGLSLTPYMKNNDIAAMDSMVNAVFDSGYYQSLSLTTMTGEIMISRKNTTQIKGVPSTFINYLNLRTPEGESVIMSGWNQAGILKLKAHPGIAYKKVWDACNDLLLWFLLVLILSFITAFILLRMILRPLHAVENQALKIAEREFPIVTNIPKTRELKRIVLAMNKMSQKVESIINKLSTRAEQHRRQTYEDNLTGLFNRQYFITALEHKIKDPEQAGNGYITIVRINHFAEYNKNFGHQAGDDLLQSIAKLLMQTSEKINIAALSRLSGVDFAAILPLADFKIATQFAQTLSHAFSMMNHEHAQHIHIGMAPFEQTSTTGNTLANADTALASVQHQGTGNYNIQQTQSEAMGNHAWKILIQKSLLEERITFLMQPIMYAHTKPKQGTLYHEVLMRIQNSSGENISPASFSAMAERVNLHLQVDQYVIQHVIQLLNKRKVQSCLAVKISALHLNNANFLFWLQELLQQHTSVASKLYFEISEHGLAQNIEASRNFIDLVQKQHGKVIMEHFGTQKESFQTLRQLKVDYIKLDGSYVAGIMENNEHQSFIQTLVDTAYSLDIKTIVEHVETQEEADYFKNLGILAMQGYLIGKPSTLS